jgi:hypothetical protein
MATAFQKGNRRATVGADHASVYVPNGVVAASNINSIVPTVIQQVVPWAFKGVGQIEITSPPGFILPNGVTFGQATLVANSSGSYAAGFHPIVQYSVQAASANLNFTAQDVLIVQY